jgi:predicted DCC family thiol-disulfide oxidoreductase YuxK
MDTPHPVILFDGICNLCNGAVQFIIRHDPEAVFRFASLQSDFAKGELEKLGKSSLEFESIILLDDGVYQKSSAALKITRHLSGAWPALSVFKVVPLFLRDWVYDRIAKSRYKVFGKRETCMIPSSDLESRFFN